MTAAKPPMRVQIADDIRIKIERGELAASDPLPTLHELATQWSCSVTVARDAIKLLKQQGLISGGRGTAPRVRRRPRLVRRSSERHQVEKDHARLDQDDRAELGEAELDMDSSLDELDLRASYETMPASDELAELFSIRRGTKLLRREFQHVDRRTEQRHSWSVSYLPHKLASKNPALLDEGNEPWPGGTMHQLDTVGVEVMSVVDEVTASMPTTVAVQQWGLDEGVPILHVRRLSYDRDGQLVEVSDAEYPADRTLLQFTTPLRSW